MKQLNQDQILRDILTEIQVTRTEVKKSNLRTEDFTQSISQNIQALTIDKEQMSQKIDIILERVKWSGKALTILMGNSRNRILCQTVALSLYVVLFYYFILI
jgi:hypothetical protein|tara:strand:+ start:117 stop:422 length:306 start_codon:yes stop_codon:yes gene_type:complete